MKNIHRTSILRVVLLVAFVSVLAGTSLLQHISAAAGQMYVSPGSSTLQNGSTKSFQIRVHPSAPADSVNATLNYDKSKLQFVSVSGAGSPFTIEFVNNGGNGSVNIQRGILGSTVSTDVLVATVTFKALVGGNATAALDLSGYTLSGGNQSSLAVIDGSVTLTSPTTGTPPSGGGGSSTPPSSGGSDSGGSGGDGSSDGGSDGGGSSSDGSGQDGGDDGNPSRPNVKIKRREFRRLVFSIEAKKKIRTYILFGTDRDQLKIATQKTKLGKSHEVSLPSTLLIPGTTFHYKVVSEDEQGNKTESEVQSVKTKGYTVRVLVLDKLDRRIRNSKVVLHSEPMEATTDEDGHAVFTDVAPGKHELEYVQGDQTYRAPVVVQEDRIKTAPDGTQTADEQQTVAHFGSVEYIAPKSLPVVPAAVAAALLLALVGGYLVLKKRNANSFARAGTSQPYTAPQAPVYPERQDDSNNEHLISKAQGVNRPDPGSVVSPNHDDEEKK